ncbi:MAG: hypothetical protein V4615_02345 [Bacteroidota bacterium]
MNKLKGSLKSLEEKREKLDDHRNFILYYDTAELEFVKSWRGRNSVYKEEELQIVDGLLERLNFVTKEANAVLLDIKAVQTRAAAQGSEPQESSLNDFIGNINALTKKIETLDAECNVILKKLPAELALGTP